MWAGNWKFGEVFLCILGVSITGGGVSQIMGVIKTHHHQIGGVIKTHHPQMGGGGGVKHHDQMDRMGPVAEMTLAAILFSVVLLLLMSVVIFASELELLPIMNQFNQLEKLFHFSFGAKDHLYQLF